MELVVFDIGGTAIKHAVVTDKGVILEKGKAETSTEIESLFNAIVKIKNDYARKYTLSGAAFSTPGLPNQKTGFIDGGSAIPYLHQIPFKQEAKVRLDLDVSFENDANCAALAEMWLGGAQGMKDIIMVVCGSGIGGSIIKNGRIHRGANGYAGEFGYMVMNRKGETFSGTTSPVELAKRVSAARGEEVDAVHSFELARTGDHYAIAEVERHYYYLGVGLYNLQLIYDPEVILIGGAISVRPDYIPSIYKKINLLVEANRMISLKPTLKSCQFGNDANLIGAVAHFNQSFHPKSEIAG